MYKYIRKSIVLFLSILFCVSASGCSNEINDVVGVWEFYDVDFSDSGIISEQELSALKVGFSSTKIILNDVGTGEFIYISQTLNITWEMKDETTINTFLDGVLFKELGYSDNILYFSVDSEKVLSIINLKRTNTQ